jgi:hypothetical protein
MYFPPPCDSTTTRVFFPLKKIIGTAVDSVVSTERQPNRRSHEMPSDGGLEAIDIMIAAQTRAAGCWWNRLIGKVARHFGRA